MVKFTYTFPVELISALKKSIYIEDTCLFHKVNEYAIKAGYIVHPNACSQATLIWAKQLVMNPNSTFYKSWADIEKRDECELALNQLLHYLTTYGVRVITGEDSIEGNGFTLNDEPLVLDYKNYKVITATQPKEIFADLYSMLKSGIALNSDIVSQAVKFIKHYDFLSSVKLDDVQNKEAQALLSLAKGQLPDDEFGILRVLVYIMTGSTMLIKSNEFIQQIKMGATTPDAILLLNSLTEDQMKSLAHIFLRYKPIFLAMKSANSATVNRIRRLAVKHHKPLVKGFWETILSENSEDTLTIARRNASDISNFKKIQLMEGILYRKQNPENQFYHIRNGKTFIRSDYSPKSNDKFLTRLYEILMDSLIDSLKKKHVKEDGTLKTIKLPKELSIVCPTSEKNFVGNIPSGSFIKTDNENIILGIYWRNEWGTNDFDLHYSGLDGTYYGWCSQFKKGKDVLFSGDMTNADPEASECFYLKQGLFEGSLAVHRFYGTTEKSKFRFYIAKEERDSLEHNYMVDPSKITFDCMIDTEDDGEHQIGFVFDEKVYISNESLSCGQVPNECITELYKETFLKKLKAHITIKDLLTVAGFELVEENADIDLSQLNKADLINFFSEN